MRRFGLYFTRRMEAHLWEFLNDSDRKLERLLEKWERENIGLAELART